jgi:hypothetical protein
MERSPFFMEMEVELSAHLLEFLFLLSDGPCDAEQLASGRRTPTRRRKWAVGDKRNYSERGKSRGLSPFSPN